MIPRQVLVLFAAWTIGAAPSPALAQNAAAAALRIVVVEGEDAVNIVQQKTAVAPVVEVRDRNDQPVAGVVVTFAIRNGRATFNGVRTLTVTTNAAGRAAAAGLTPTGSGAIQISASAIFQGQTAAATIAQTNVMTAAQAANASAAGASGGGGIGPGTITAIAGGAVGGVIGYQQYRKYVEGDPPTISGMQVQPVAGIQNATTFVAAQGEMTWHGPDNPEDDGATLRCEWGDGNSDTHSMAFGGAGIAICQHVFGSTGTFRIRVTITDQWDRGASAEGTAQVATVTGQWTSSASAGVYALSQTGSGVAGTFSPPTGASAAVSGSVSARASTPFGFPDPGRVTLTLPTLVGSTVVLATFTASPTFNGAVLDVNRLVGALVGPGVNNPNVTLTRQ